MVGPPLNPQLDKFRDVIQRLSGTFEGRAVLLYKCKADNK